MNTTRREFLNKVGMASVAMSAAAGCATKPGAATVAAGVESLAGAPMQGFRTKPMAEIRVGLVGVGMRGWRALHRLSMVPGVRVTAMCDIFQDRLDRERAWLKEYKKPAAKEYVGEEAYKALCESSEVDVVYICTPWDLHVPVGLYALNHGKHAFIEVPAAMTVDDCWALVETAEKQKLHCMQLENSGYGQDELLALSLCRKGVLGTLCHAECGYIHDRRQGVFLDDYPKHWRMQWNIDHAGNQYPTHGIGPVCQCFDVNRGDRLDFLVSVDSLGGAYEAYANEVFKEGTKDAWKRDLKFRMGNMNITTVKTVKGKTILVEHDVCTARPYTRINLISGTKGIFRAFPLRIHLETPQMKPAEHHTAFDPELTEKYRQLYAHPLWKTAGKIAMEVGGHDGMDYLMDLRWAFCLKEGLPLDMDVYDLAATCSVCELSERSVNAGSAPQKVPDFTRGGWQTAKPLELVNVDLQKMGFTKEQIISGGASMKV